MNKAVVLAGGGGSRIGKKNRYELKVMLPIGDKPILQRNIEILRDQLGIHSIILIVGYKSEIIKTYFGDGRGFDVNIQYVDSDPKLGIADACLLAEKKISGTFCLMLGDEYYLNSNHYALLEKTKYNDSDSIITFIKGAGPQEIANNYSIKLDKNMLVSELIEKPVIIENDLLGLGTFVLNDSIFEYIRNTPVNPCTGRRELVDSISNMAKEKRVYAHELAGSYVNINTNDDWYFAQYLTRSHIFNSTQKSLVIPTYNEAMSIAYVIDDFKHAVDEIVIADGGSNDGTVRIVESFYNKCNIKLVQGKYLGYGDAIRNGIDAASGDIVVLVEGDATFRSRDIQKIYEYIKDCDMVIGTRTTKQLICQGANMNFWLRVGNVIAGKMIELLWIKDEPRFTDVGCSYRAFWKSAYDEIKHNFTGLGPEFSPEMMVEFINNGKRVIEIPVSYYKRIGGASKHSGNILGVIKMALRMARLVLKKRLMVLQKTRNTK